MKYAPLAALLVLLLLGCTATPQSTIQNITVTDSTQQPALQETTLSEQVIYIQDQRFIHDSLNLDVNETITIYNVDDVTHYLYGPGTDAELVPTSTTRFTPAEAGTYMIISDERPRDELILHVR